MTDRTLQDLLDDDTIGTMSMTDPDAAEILSTHGDGCTQLSFGAGRAPGSSPYWLVVGEPAAGQTTLLQALLSSIDDEVQGGGPR